MSLPDYTVKTSTRARHVRFKITASDGLSVVIPRGFNPAGIPELLVEKQAWIEKDINAGALVMLRDHLLGFGTIDAVRLPGLSDRPPLDVQNLYLSA